MIELNKAMCSVCNKYQWVRPSEVFHNKVREIMFLKVNVEYCFTNLICKKCGHTVCSFKTNTIRSFTLLEEGDRND